MFRRLLCGMALVVLVGCGGNDDPEVPSATIAPADDPTSTTTTTEALTPEEEVEAAYLRSWAVYAAAMREVDDSQLAEVFDGDLLELRRQEIADLRESDAAAVIDVDHDYVIEVFVEDRALITERYFNRSVLIDPETEEPREPVPNEVVARQYQMRRMEGVWKVVFAKAL